MRHIPSTHPTLKNHIAICEISGVTFIFAYLPPSPSMPDTCIDDLIELASSLITGPESKVVVAGDLNARSTALTGDSKTLPRGRTLEAALDHTPFLVQQPIEGKWTSRTRQGRGIPDVVISNFPITDLTVLENETASGSDHVPLVFTVPEMRERGQVVKRWNVKRLTKPRIAAKFSKLLGEDLELAVLELEAKEAVEEVKAGRLTGAELQERLNVLWGRFVDALGDAAKQPLGVLVYDTRTPNGFWTEELEEEREAAKEAQLEAVRAMMDPDATAEHVNQAWDISREKSAKLRENSLKRSSGMFQMDADDMGHPSKRGAFMRRVKGRRSRQSKGGCALDPEKLDQDAGYFHGTFGGEQTGEAPDPYEPAKVGEAEELGVEVLINPGTVRTMIKQLPRGKAWGSDNIPAEFLACGGEPLIPTLVALYSLTFLAELVPDPWRIALVVPVFKKKGSPDDIANYRPISLTSVLRRGYERLLLADINRFVHLLEDSQGGFRPRRGTSHQALALHEALVCNKSFVRVALLDLRAAYDLAARDRLWHKLRTDYGFPPHTVARIADLFDANVSRLIVGGKQSADIRNLRGLLQGSSMSPVLFNFLINELAREWAAMNVGVEVHGVRINSLLLADDAAALGRDDRELAAMLKVGEDWSRRAGMEFSPAKCVVFAPPINQRAFPLTMYEQHLRNVISHPYLGFPFTIDGIDHAKLCEERCAKASAVIATLQSVGMNATGWSPAAAAQVYITFVRPVLEYGWDISPPSPAALAAAQKVQNRAMRTLFSAPANTSIAAMHRLLGAPVRQGEVGRTGVPRRVALHGNQRGVDPGGEGLEGSHVDGEVSSGGTGEGAACGQHPEGDYEDKPPVCGVRGHTHRACRGSPHQGASNHPLPPADPGGEEGETSRGIGVGGGPGGNGGNGDGAGGHEGTRVFDVGDGGDEGREGDDHALAVGNGGGPPGVQAVPEGFRSGGGAVEGARGGVRGSGGHPGGGRGVV